MGNLFTFRRPGYGPIIPDISFAYEDIVNQISDFRVVEDYTASAHETSFRVDIASRNPTDALCPASVQRWNFHHLDYDISRESIVSMEDFGDIGGKLKRHVMLVLGRNKLYWWSPEIALLRQNCLGLQWAAQRTSNQLDVNTKSTMHKAAKRESHGVIDQN